MACYKAMPGELTMAVVKPKLPPPLPAGCKAFILFNTLSAQSAPRLLKSKAAVNINIECCLVLDFLTIIEPTTRYSYY